MPHAAPTSVSININNGEPLAPMHACSWPTLGLPLITASRPQVGCRIRAMPCGVQALGLYIYSVCICIEAPIAPVACS